MLLPFRSPLCYSSDSSFFTSESVSEGHPDKVADQISDAILDELLTFDPYARVACEALCKTGLVVIAGEITVNPETVAKNEKLLGRNIASFSDIARDVIKEIGYNDANNGFDYRSCGIIVALDKQSPDIAQGVDASATKEMGAGDQGMMFGFAVNETEELMPASLQYSHLLLKNLALARKQNKVDWLRPDAKAQVTVEYVGNKIKRIDTIVLSTMHAESISQAALKEFVIEEIIKKTIPKNLLDETTKYHINPTGRFVIGGPQGDCGLTGRKIIVDSYGGHCAHGGGAFSGKDPTKVDRSAAYMGRYIAKNIVAAGLADKVCIQIAYAIGIAHPVSIHLNTYGSEKVSQEKIEQAIRTHFDCTPAGIVGTFQLLHPRENNFSYRETAAYGHFGKKHFPWEKTDKAQALKLSCGL